MMRAKMTVASVTSFGEFVEQLRLTAVCKKEGYADGGEDEDNTYAKFSPSATLDITIANPALTGKFRVGQTFYVDFTEVIAPVAAEPAATEVRAETVTSDFPAATAETAAPAAAEAQTATDGVAAPAPAPAE